MMDDEKKIKKVPILRKKDHNALVDKPSTVWGEALRRLRRNRTFIIAIVILSIYIIMAVGAPIFARYDYAVQFRKDGLTKRGSPVAPNSMFWFGTDTLGRDLYSRIVYGSRVALTVGLSVAAGATFIGMVFGSASGMIGGWVDNVLMRGLDVFMSIPPLFLILLFVAISQPSIWMTILVLSLTGWAGPARVFRSQILSVKEQDFILAERCLGASNLYIFFKHIIPQLLPLIIVYAGLAVPGAIFSEAGLAFLGLGVPPPAPTWGAMVSQGVSMWRNAWWMLLFPGLALILLIVCFNLIADGLRQALDPRLKGK